MIRPSALFLFILSLVSAAPLLFAVDHIVFLRIAPTQATLYTSNANGSGERPLTEPGALNYNPAWSHKGDWIVFTSERSGSADLYRVHPDGTGVERLTDDPAYDDQAAFSPDDKYVVFVSTRAIGTANLWRLDLATHIARPLTGGRGGDFRPSYSPDGRWIAFSSDRGSELPAAKGRWERLHLVDLYLIHPDGSGLKRLSQHGNFCGSPRWTSDSKSVIAYCMSAEETYTYRVLPTAGETKLVQFDIATGTTTPVPAGPGVKMYPSVLGSGQVAYLRRDTVAPGVFYADGRPGPTGADLRSPSWSPDGRHIVYSRYVTKRVPEPTKLWSRNPNFEFAATGWLPAYDPSGQHFAVTVQNPDESTSLMIVDSGKPARTLLQRRGLIISPQWSPDSQRVLFGIGAFTSFIDLTAGGASKPLDRVNGGAQVGVINADGTGFTLITSGSNNNAFASFAPDGKHIVYRTAGPEGEGLRIMNIEDHSTTTLTTEYDNFPVWSPRRDLIAFIRKVNDNFEVFTIHPDGTALKQLTHTRGNEAHLAWSPDGERLLFCSTRMGFKDEALYTSGPQPYGEVFAMRYDGTQIEQLTDDQWEEGGPAWQPQPPKPVATISSTR